MSTAGSNKLRMLYIMVELLEKSDETNKISTKMFTEMLERNGISAERKSIASDIRALKEWGMDIEYSKVKPAGYYVCSREFELPELKLLVDAVQASKFITVKKSRELIRKLGNLASKGEADLINRQVHVINRIKTQNESIYYNVDKIHSAISNNAKISFEYYKWNTDKKLVPRNDGKPLVVSPWALTWDDENYYMLGYDEAAGIIKHYRVDKMKNIRRIRAKRKGEEVFAGYDMAQFAKGTFGMYGGEEYKVTLQCESHLIGPILDRFGTDMIVANMEEDCFQVHRDIVVSGQFFGWLAGLGPGVKIVAPAEVREQYKEWLRRLLEYEEETE
ncbi:MAG: helix-turn-helix transcriptional regulator [Lentihominibacter sp.]|jgi:predicted DNA-binding transcriptional regulator YafY